MTTTAINGNWLRRKATDPVVKGLFRAARQSDYAAALALLDRLSEMGHYFAESLRNTVSAQVGWSDGYRARFVSWRIEEYMCGARALVGCNRCGKQTVWNPHQMPPPGWMLDRVDGKDTVRCEDCHGGFGRAFGGRQ